jgi:hypothetical protein
MAVIDELLAEATTAKNAALLEQLRAKLDNYWKHRPKSRWAVRLSKALLPSARFFPKNDSSCDPEDHHRLYMIIKDIY